MIPGPELSDEAVPVGFTVDGSDDETPVAVGSDDETLVAVGSEEETLVVDGITFDPELAGMAATSEFVEDTLPGTSALAGVEARPSPVAVVLTPVVAGEAVAELVEIPLGEEPEEIVGLDAVPAAATEPPVAPAVGVGADLIDEFTVACGLALTDGGMYFPVGWEGIFL